ncbi:hypothetical protein GN244_ATG18171 [Phytophthora infestans]|uniref:DDE-1 domain-containing protein n=1 Tax=Phytophthora infestans TaxID=4787 RepID=A0A833S9B0_PHYIN|nr:hypothetical protein GN244_ATG18171 [Phytophthora infestans]
MQDVARERVADIQREAPSSVFRVTPPDRNDIVSWVCSSWNSLTASIIVGGFARAGILGDTWILGDTRVHEDEGDEANDEIPAPVKELKKLGVVREEQDLTCDKDED